MGSARAGRDRGRPAGAARRRTPAPGTGPIATALLALQAAAGNRAVARVVVQRAGPAPTPFEPDQPVQGSELGVTRSTGSTMPTFRVTPERKLAATTAGSVSIDARYVGPGPHDWGVGEDGAPRRLLVPPAISDLARQGEQEHADDIWWAHQLVAGEAARAINELATQPAAPGAGQAEAHRHWRGQLHDRISPKLRIDAAESDPGAGGSVSSPWFAALASLRQVTLDRDDKGWHTMRTRTPTAAEATANPVPAGTRLVVAQAGGEIGRHPAEAYMRAAFQALPDRP